MATLRYCRPRALLIFLVVAAILDEYLFIPVRLRCGSQRETTMPALVVGGALGHPDRKQS
jgi:hypothetical protein